MQGENSLHKINNLNKPPWVDSSKDFVERFGGYSVAVHRIHSLLAISRHLNCESDFNSYNSE